MPRTKKNEDKHLATDGPPLPLFDGLPSTPWASGPAWMGTDGAGLKPRLRDYQEEAFLKVCEAFDRGKKGTLVVIPTGGGKTLLFAAIGRFARSRGLRVLYLAHTDELIGQARKKLRAYGVPTVLEKAHHDGLAEVRKGGMPGLLDGDSEGPVGVVASIQTLKGERLERWPRDYFDLIVVDEAHHTLTPSYLKILGHFDCKFVGFTATPERGDKGDLGQVYDNICYQAYLWDMIDRGYLCRIEGKKSNVRIDLSHVRIAGKDFSRTEIEDLVIEYIGPLVHGAIDAAKGCKHPILFTPCTVSAKEVAKSLGRCGESAAFVSGADAFGVTATGKIVEGSREDILGGFSAGTYKWLVNCQLFLEGFDEPLIDAVVIMRPTMSRSLLMQMIGRGLRPVVADDGTVVKDTCRVVDFAWQTERHSIATVYELLCRPGTTPGQLADALKVIDHDADEGKPVDYLKVIDQIRENDEEEKARKDEIRNRVAAGDTDFGWKTFDPLKGKSKVQKEGWGPLGLTVRQERGQWDEPPSPEQAKALTALGLSAADVDGLCHRTAKATLKKLNDRRKVGLATYKQVKTLMGAGWSQPEAASMTLGEASRAIDAAKANGWRRPA